MPVLATPRRKDTLNAKEVPKCIRPAYPRNRLLLYVRNSLFESLATCKAGKSANSSVQTNCMHCMSGTIYGNALAVNEASCG